MTPIVKKKNEEIDIDSVQPFQLVKFFSFSGLVLFLISTIALSWVISNYAKKFLIQRSESYALVLAENLNHQVFTQFVLPTAVRYGKIALRNKDQYQLLDTIVRNTIHGLNVESVTIYDSSENIISYSTVTDMISLRDVGGVEYELALKGEENSVFESKGSMLGILPGGQAYFCQLRTYIPFRQERPRSESTDVVMGVFELVQDLSADFEAIMQFQSILIISSVFIMATLFVVLRFIVARADRIMDARAEERRRLAEKLNQAERLAGLGKMVASVSHEIKNPLGIVRSTAEMLKKRLHTVAPENEKFAAIIMEETTRLDGIVREFLDFARPQVPQLREVVVNELLSKVLTFMEPEFEKSGIIMKQHLPHRQLICRADSDQLHRAFLNIAVNAVQAMPQGGVLTVTLLPYNVGNNTGMVCRFSDTGSGLSQLAREQMFQPFYTEKNRGTGLGLSIVKNIIDSHGGRIEVESEQGRGATFSIILEQ